MAKRKVQNDNQRSTKDALKTNSGAPEG